ncbi:MAG: FG-GAP repeat domain-containing protein [Planctomyces sp.]
MVNLPSFCRFGLSAGRALLLAGVATSGVGCDQSSPPTAKDLSAASDAAAVASTQSWVSDSEPRMRTFCGGCHALPSPQSFPRDDWYHEVQRGFDFYYQSGRRDLQPPVQADVVRWYQSQAPEQLQLPDLSSTTSARSFTRQEIAADGKSVDASVAVSFVGTLSPIAPAMQSRLLVSEMNAGRIYSLDPVAGDQIEYAAEVQNPAAVREVDLDGDNRLDLLIAELGSPLPADHDRGKVILLSDYRGAARRQVLLEGIGRVADVRAADFDGDGDLDVVAAEFGWHTTGGLHLLWQDRMAEGSKFRSQRLDSRSGPIHVPVTDLDGDGRLDFIVLVSQEHEVVEAFLNRGDQFERVPLFAAPDPSWGSSGIELTDFDGDGDQDVLYTAGDAFDSYLIKPWHGIWLLRNEGGLKFQAQQIAALPGVHRALAADLDQDGDQDIAACAMVPARALQAQPGTPMQSVIWLEQTADGAFARHVISAERPIHAAMTVLDADSDGDMDLAAGCFAESRSESKFSLLRFLNAGQPAAVAGLPTAVRGSAAGR